MKYKCKTISMNKVIIDHQGVITPLCDCCKSADCDNPIELRKVSFLGIMKQNRVYVRNDEPSFVIMCEGFIP